MAVERPDIVTLALRQAWRLTRGMTLGVRIAAVRKDGQVCLVRHTYVKGLHLPGGGVERDETIYDAAKKELFQETGLDAPKEAFALRHFYLNRRFRGDHVALLTVDNAVAAGEPDGREIREVVWTDPAAPPAETTDATRTRLCELFGGRAVSPYWT